MVYATNPTMAINLIIRSPPLQPGDEILATDHEYGAMDRTWHFIAQKTGAAYRQQPIPLQVTTPEAFIDMDENVNLLLGKDDADLLTFTIALKDLTGLTVSGLADVEMDTLSTTGLDVEMSGAGQFKLEQLDAESVNINLSGLGNVDISGEVTQATIEISGAGSVNAADLRCQMADVNIPGLGGATVWVTERLTGNISGGGSVNYYGSPQVDTETSGLGQFEKLGDK